MGPIEMALAPQLILDLAIDALELISEIRDQQFQRIFAGVDDTPELGALRVAQAVISEPDPRLHDVAPPQAGALAVDIDGSVWHALSPRRRAASDGDNATGRDKFPAGSWHG